MSMLKKATNKMAYAKVGLYGDTGSGKSRTAAEIAIGLVKEHKLEKPIGIYDTEPAWSWLLPVIKAAGLPEPYVYDESRAFKDLMAWVDEAKDACSVLIVDSITHVWRDLQVSCLARVNESRRRNNKRPLAGLEFQHWGPIKEQWAELTDEFLSSNVHFIICGRAGSIYEFQDKDDGSGKKELITVGTKMATEKEMGYEPSLLIEMLREIEDGAIINTGFIQKDRADQLNGKQIQFPTFEKLRAHFDRLNIGGVQHGSMRTRDSKEVFEEVSEGNFDSDMKRKEVALDEIKEELGKHHGLGQDRETKEGKAITLEKATACVMPPDGTRSWTKVESFRLPEVLRVRDELWKLTRGHRYGESPPEAPTKDVLVPVASAEKQDAA
jgi:hypothetical protein